MIPVTAGEVGAVEPDRRHAVDGEREVVGERVDIVLRHGVQAVALNRGLDLALERLVAVGVDVGVADWRREAVEIDDEADLAQFFTMAGDLRGRSDRELFLSAE